MATFEWHQSRTDGVTLVELLVTSETTTEVRIESHLTPVWPPKQQGVPEAGWDGNSFETTVEAGDRVIIGYASPAPPDGPPARIQNVSAEATDNQRVDARTLVRALGEAKPPRDLVPAAPRGESHQPTDCTESENTTGANNETAGSDTASSGQTANRTTEACRSMTDHKETQAPTGPKTVDQATAPSSTTEVTETELEAWFSAVEQRVADAEQLAGIETPSEATAAVTAVGGIESVKQLQAQLVADRERLEQLSEREQQLSDRLQTVEIPTGVLERVA